MNKEYLYVGYYIDTCGRVLLKIGTTCDLDRRRKEHNYNYRKSPEYTMPADGTFTYLWHLPLSKYNTLRFEDRNRELWKFLGIGEFIRNDRFVIPQNLEKVTVKIRKEYVINLPSVW